MIAVALYVILMPLKISYMYSPEFAELNFLKQSVYLLVCIIGARFKYYSVWSLGMISVNATGITYNPVKN